MAREEVLTPEGFKKLKGEIEHLRTEKRREVAERIKAAREFGDISENAEYDHAKNEQAMLEAQISRLEDKLRSATILDQKSLEKGIVSIGSKVRVKDQKSGKSVQYQIVGSAEPIRPRTRCRTSRPSDKHCWATSTVTSSPSRSRAARTAN
jgi:transcription elongation factor GreA